MSAKYTKGPWEVDGQTIRGPEVSIATVLDVAWPYGKRPESPEANARLIAAAPDLLEALQLMLEQFTKIPSTFRDSEARCKAHAAMAKATGENQ